MDFENSMMMLMILVDDAGVVVSMNVDCWCRLARPLNAALIHRGFAAVVEVKESELSLELILILIKGEIP